MSLLTAPPTNAAELLCTATVKELLKDAGNPAPIYIEATATVEEGCNVLHHHDISSAPLYYAVNDEFIGVLDYRDLSTYVLKVFHKIPSENKFSAEAEMGLSDIVKLASLDKQGVPVHLITNLSRRDALVPIDSSALLLDACKLLVKEKVHRLIVMDSTIPKGPERFVGVLSDSSICRFVTDRFGKLGGSKRMEGATWAEWEKSVADLGLVNEKVVSIQKEDSVLDAFTVMHDHGVSALPVVEGAKLVGTISMTDIREIINSRRNWKHLYDSSFIFFQNTVSKLGIERGADRVPSIVVRPETSLMMAMERMVGARIHRIWVVENGDTLKGILTMSDLMPLLLSGC